MVQLSRESFLDAEEVIRHQQIAVFGKNRMAAIDGNEASISLSEKLSERIQRGIDQQSRSVYYRQGNRVRERSLRLVRESGTQYPLTLRVNPDCYGGGFGSGEVDRAPWALCDL